MEKLFRQKHITLSKSKKQSLNCDREYIFAVRKNNIFVNSLNSDAHTGKIGWCRLLNRHGVRVPRRLRIGGREGIANHRAADPRNR
jgi:hypothetical protein